NTKPRTSTPSTTVPASRMRRSPSWTRSWVPSGTPVLRGPGRPWGAGLEGEGLGEGLSADGGALVGVGGGVTVGDGWAAAAVDDGCGDGLEDALPDGSGAASSPAVGASVGAADGGAASSVASRDAVAGGVSSGGAGRSALRETTARVAGRPAAPSATTPPAAGRYVTSGAETAGATVRAVVRHAADARTRTARPRRVMRTRACRAAVRGRSSVCFGIEPPSSETPRE